MTNKHDIIFSAKQQAGFNLVELMVSATIGLIIMLGVLAVYENGKRTYRNTDTQSKQQEYARYAFNRLTQELRMIGYAGCLGSLNNLRSVLNSSTDFEYQFNVPLQGYEGQTSGWSPTINANIDTPKSGTDVITFRAAYGEGPNIKNHKGLNSQGDGELVVDKIHNMNTGDIIMVSDCEDAVITQISSIDESPADVSWLSHNTGGTLTPGNQTLALGKKFDGGEIMKVATTTYMIRETSGELPGLWRQNGGEDSVKLLNGVEDMQILYGEDANSADDIVAATHYRKASAVSDWNNVVSIRISLLLVSENDKVASGSQNYTFNGTDYTASDNRLRSVFNTTVTLRNKSG